MIRSFAPAPRRVVLRCDAAPFLAVLARLDASLAQAPEGVLQALDALVGLPQFGKQLVAVDVDEKTARLWWEGVSAPRAHVLALVIAQYPAAAGYLLPEAA